MLLLVIYVIVGNTGVAYFHHNLITTGDDVKFTITWDDESNKDGERPQSIIVRLHANGGDGVQGNLKEVVLSPSSCEISPDGNTWTYVFTDLQKYANRGRQVTYSISIDNYNQGVYNILQNFAPGTGNQTDEIATADSGYFFTQKLSRPEKK